MTIKANSAGMRSGDLLHAFHMGLHKHFEHGELVPRGGPGLPGPPSAHVPEAVGDSIVQPGGASLQETEPAQSVLTVATT
jgi:hypothetical protein